MSRHARIEIEDEPQLDLRHDLGVVGIADRRHAAGAKQDGVGLLAKPDGGIRHRPAGFLVVHGARRRFGETELQAWRGRLDLLQDFERRVHHLRSNAVAGEDRDVEGVVGVHIDTVSSLKRLPYGLIFSASSRDLRRVGRQSRL
jgi:hypothetical protein